MADANLNEIQTPESLAASHNRKVKNPNYRQRKRPLGTKPLSDTDIYVTAKSNFQAQLKKILKSFEDGEKEVVVHGLGKGITRAANIALQVEEKLSHTVVLSVNTDTVEFQDDWEPLADEAVPYTTSRLGSALHVKITRVPEFPV